MACLQLIKTDCEDASTAAMCVFSNERTSWRKCQIAMCQLVFTHVFTHAIVAIVALVHPMIIK